MTTPELKEQIAETIFAEPWRAWHEIHADEARGFGTLCSDEEQERAVGAPLKAAAVGAAKEAHGARVAATYRYDMRVGEAACAA